MKLIKRKSTKKYASEIKSFCLVGEGDEYADYGFNIVKKGSGYERCIGAVRETLYGSCPREPVITYYSHATSSLFMVTSSIAFAFNTATTQKFKAITTKVAPSPFFVDAYVDGKWVTVYFCGKNRLVYDGDAATESQGEREYFTGVMHCGRLFARDYNDPLKIWWTASGALDETEGIYGGGYTVLTSEGGDVVRLVSFGEKLIAVRQYGITVIRAYGEPQHYKVEPTAEYLVSDGIVGETCAVCAGKLFFATKSGIYAFDGGEITKVENPEQSRLSAPVRAVACADTYYLVCMDSFLGGNVIFGYDAVGKVGWIMNVSPSGLFNAEGDAYLVYGTGVYKIAATDTSRGYWRSKELDFGTPSVKYLRRLYIEGDADVNSTILCGGTSREITGNGWQTVNMYAASFRFIFGAYSKLTRVVAEVEVRSGI